MNVSKMLAIIPARGGSKGVPRKNIAPLAGKPLIAWTIEAARGTPGIEATVVSSDDQEILSIAAGYGAEPLKRPAELATDTVEAALVLQHALQSFKKNHGALPTYVAYLQPTSPLRNAAHLSAAFSLLEEKEADAVISVREIDSTFLKAYVESGEGYITSASRPEFTNMNRQMLPKLYMPNGAIYIMRAEACLTNPRFEGDRTVPFVMTEEDSLDVDTSADLAMASRLLEKRTRI